jgi:hypothetical protein
MKILVKQVLGHLLEGQIDFEKVRRGVPRSSHLSQRPLCAFSTIPSRSSR